MRPVHSRNTRYYINAGISVPECEVNRRLLRMCRWLFATVVNGYEQGITCPRCIKAREVKRHIYP